MRAWRRGGTDRPGRQAAERRGRGAEFLAAWWMRAKGYRVLARRAKTPLGEIDLIARRGAVIAFIEVKARDDLTLALQALTPVQCRRIERAAQWWLGHRRDAAHADLRFDLIAVMPHRLPRHLPDAWRPQA
ncbi:YraN family protein [Pacificispira sp.]|uniref:YraN family protein n=1 Tax=Pacificispira sp. TaxID=2888761 RepID=UPI002EAE8617|nr:YraN family protein [Pseudomonadota bacterium]